jgi:hypothetical protein
MSICKRDKGYDVGTHHIGLLNANGTYGEALELTTGKEVDVSVVDMLQFWWTSVYASSILHPEYIPKTSMISSKLSICARPFMSVPTVLSADRTALGI